MCITVTILGEEKNSEASDYAVLSSLMLLPPSYVKIFFSAPCSQTSIIYEVNRFVP
jgi:hypothetical protein